MQSTLPLLATRDLILFPGMLAPIFVERDKGIRALEQAHAADEMLVMVAQKSPCLDDPGENDLHRVGTLAKVVQFSKLLDGTIKTLIEGRQRVIIEDYISDQPYFLVKIRPICSQSTK